MTPLSIAGKLALARRADLAALDAVARLADRCTARHSMVRAVLVHALDGAHAHRRVNLRTLAQALGIAPPTLSTRAHRAGVDLKAMLTAVQHVRVAAILEDPAISVTVASEVLDFGSSQSLGRHLRHVTRTAPAMWRRSVNGRAALEALEAMVVAHAARCEQIPRPIGAHVLSLPVATCAQCARRMAA